jgi:spermidine/putrescine transport system ATP-binding protein
MSDRIAVMLDGDIQQLASPEEIYDHPATAFVAGFIGQQNFLPGTAKGDGHELAADTFTVVASKMADDVVVGQPALAAVRPEYVTVSGSAPSEEVNVVRGTLAGTAHLGELIQYVVTTPDGRELLSRQPRSSAVRLAVGEPVWCSWQAADAHIFGAEQHDLVLPDPADPVVDTA